MGFIKATSTATSIDVDFGIYAGMKVSTGTIPQKRCFSKRELVISYYNDDTLDAQIIYNSLVFPLNFNGANGGLKVELVNGATPTSNSDLYDKLIALIG